MVWDVVEEFLLILKKDINLCGRNRGWGLWGGWLCEGHEFLMVNDVWVVVSGGDGKWK